MEGAARGTFAEIGRVALRDGVLTLESNGSGRFRLRFAGRELMSSDAHASEDALARLGLAGVRDGIPGVLVGGLGMGFTLRAALDQLSPGAEVTVVELVPEVVAWCRGPLAPLSGEALADPRVRVVVSDVADFLRAAPERRDAILLDVDNGPRWEVQRKNQLLYTEAGLRLMKGALRPGGTLAVWSADPRDPAFLRLLEKVGFEARCEAVPARTPGGPRAGIYLGTLPRLDAVRRARGR